AATTAALGVLTPMPCIPATMTPWVAGAPTVLLGNQPSLDNVSTCMCNWGGVVTIVNPATVKTMIPCQDHSRPEPPRHRQLRTCRQGSAVSASERHGGAGAPERVAARSAEH